MLFVTRTSVRLFAIVATLAAAACDAPTPPSPQPATASSPSASAPSIRDFFDSFTDEWVRANPDLAVRTRYFGGDEQSRLEQRLTPWSRAYQLETIARARDGLARLEAFDFERLAPADRVAAELMQWLLAVVVEQEPFLDYSFPLQQFDGANVALPNEFTVSQTLATAQDAANYVRRLEEFDDRMHEATAEAARGRQAGILPPAFILRSTIEQMERFVSMPPAANVLVATLATKGASIADLPTERRAELTEQATRVVETQIYPAWRAGIDELKFQLPLATEDAGLARFENGAAHYAYQLKRFTTTSLSASEIHAIGLREVARIEAEMDELLRQVGFADGSINERVKQLEARLSYPVTDEGRSRIMTDIRAMLSDAEARTAALFDRRPRLPVIAQPYPEFRWDNAAASYQAPPLDGSRPATFQMPLRPDELTQFGLRSLVYHETVPGHHLQVGLLNENTELPRFARVRAFGTISASSEGWALYAERLAAEDGWYEGDIEGRIGQLDSALFRARRLVVDTGLHAMHWTRQQAIDYGIDPSEVERYVVRPGQACAYMLGQLKIVELRERARAALGASFSIREFHNVVLGAGVVPLPVLEAAVERYIAAARG
jgi:uncharacterized protein (DUF885 family)